MTIQIIQQNGKDLVSAKELYKFLGLNSAHWKRWSEKNIVNNKFALENEDWEVFTIKAKTPNGGRPSTDYAITIDLAKKLAMMARSEKGEEARRYFIECERKMKKAEELPSTLLKLLQDIVEVRRRDNEMINSLRNQVSGLGHEILLLKSTIRPNKGYFTVAGYASYINLQINLKDAAAIGRKASAICKQRGLQMRAIPDPRFGKVRMYPKHVLDEIIDECRVEPTREQILEALGWPKDRI